MRILKSILSLRNGKTLLKIFGVFGFWLLISTRYVPLQRGAGGPRNNSVASNSTLGFGEIYVVSRPDSPRRDSIIQAANVTGLRLSILAQPIWAHEDEHDFKLAQNSSIDKGSLHAWLGHLHALRQ